MVRVDGAHDGTVIPVDAGIEARNQQNGIQCEHVLGEERWPLLFDRIGQGDILHMLDGGVGITSSMSGFLMLMHRGLFGVHGFETWEAKVVMGSYVLTR